MRQEDKIMFLLADREYHHMSELNAIGYRYGGVINRLRKKDYVIETKQLGVGNFTYRLIALPSEKQLSLV